MFILIAVVFTIMILASVLRIDQKFKGLREWIDSFGAWGPLVLALLYVGSVVAALPGLAITLAAGALLGAVKGTIVVSIASTVGATLCFLIARYFARAAIERSFASNEKFQRLDELTEKHGAIIIAITRLVPIFPFNLLNYGFGLTHVRLWTYVFWSWICMLPWTVVYVVGADAAAKGLTEKKVPWHLIAVMGALIVVLIFIVKAARKKLKTADAKQNESSRRASSRTRVKTEDRSEEAFQK